MVKRGAGGSGLVVWAGRLRLCLPGPNIGVMPRAWEMPRVTHWGPDLVELRLGPISLFIGWAVKEAEVLAPI
jgi:hypothetical protein